MICSRVNLAYFIVQSLMTDPNFKPGIFQGAGSLFFQEEPFIPV